MQKVNLLEVKENIIELVAQALNYASEKALNEDVKTLKEWMKTQPHLPEILEDKKIQNFLILNKGSIERSKEKIDMYYSIRSRMPEVFNHINPKLPYLQHVLDTLYFLPLPKLTKEMYRVFVFKVRDKDLSLGLNFVDQIRYVVAAQEIRLAEDVTYGDVFIFDGKDVTLKFMSNLTPVLIYKSLIVIYQRIFSMRLKGVYIINVPSFIGTLLTLLKGALKPKLFDRIHLCSDENFLIEQFGKEIIPKDFGGEEKSLEEIRKMVQGKLFEHQGRFDELDRMRVNEDLRPQKCVNDEELGFYGNFKKLDFD